MAYTTINKSTSYFNTKLYSGNGSTNAITGVGFAPNFVWIKERTSTSTHVLGTTIQGTGKRLSSATTDAEASLSNIFTSFDSDGFTHGADNGVNESGQTYASWNWLAGGAASSNTDGSITSSVSANTTAGFSIVSYTGNGSASATIGHGLGVTPAMIIVKNRTEAGTSWCVTHKSLATDKVLRLEGTNAEGDIGDGELDSPPNNSSTFGFNNGTSGTPLKVVNESSDSYLAYCFAEKTGYSKFGSYVGNGNADGTFVYTGFAPAFVIVKRTDAAGDWVLFDNKRPGENPTDLNIAPNTTGAEIDEGQGFDFLSNGFKIREAGNFVNAGSQPFIYMAFGQSLVGSNNVPCNAR